MSRSDVPRIVGQTLENLAIVDPTVQIQYMSCIFRKVFFQGAIRDSTFTDCKFEHCEFRGTVDNTRFDSVTFNDVGFFGDLRFVGLNRCKGDLVRFSSLDFDTVKIEDSKCVRWSFSNLPNSHSFDVDRSDFCQTTFENVRIQKSAFDHVSFSGTILRSEVCRGCVRNTRFERCTIALSSFKDTAFESSFFRETVATQCTWMYNRFVGCSFFKTRFLSNRCSACVFERGVMRDVGFESSVLDHTLFEHIQQQDLVLHQCDLRDSTVRGAFHMKLPDTNVWNLLRQPSQRRRIRVHLHPKRVYQTFHATFHFFGTKPKITSLEHSVLHADQPWFDLDRHDIDEDTNDPLVAIGVQIVPQSFLHSLLQPVDVFDTIQHFESFSILFLPSPREPNIYERVRVRRKQRSLSEP